MTRPDWFRPVDERILDVVRGEPTYVAVVAAETGRHLPLVERRLDRLTAAGFVEVVADDCVYRLTDDGSAALDADAEPSPRTGFGRSPVDAE